MGPQHRCPSFPPIESTPSAESTAGAGSPTSSSDRGPTAADSDHGRHLRIQDHDASRGRLRGTHRERVKAPFELRPLGGTRMEILQDVVDVRAARRWQQRMRPLVEKVVEVGRLLQPGMPGRSLPDPGFPSGRRDINSTSLTYPLIQEHVGPDDRSPTLQLLDVRQGMSRPGSANIASSVGIALTLEVSSPEARARCRASRERPARE